MENWHPLGSFFDMSSHCDLSDLLLFNLSCEMIFHIQIANLKTFHLDMIPMKEFGELQPKHSILNLGQGHSCPLGCSSLVLLTVFSRNIRSFYLASLRVPLKRISSNEL